MAARKHSRQRDSIKEFLMTREDHPTADVIYRNVRQRSPSISLGTIYRNLTLLAQDGEISRLNLGDGVDRFDGDTSPHYHLLCEKCGGVVDLEMDDISSVLEKAAHFDGHVAGHVTYFYGTCGRCTKSGGMDLSGGTDLPRGTELPEDTALPEESGA